MLTQYQQTRLKDLVRPKMGGAYQGTVNIRLNEFIDNLRTQYPEHFHESTDSLRKRVFSDEPVRLAGHSGLPMAGFIRPIKGWHNECI